MALALSSVFSLLFAIRGGAQTVPVRPRIVEPIDASRRVTLRGNTPPLARREYDRGAAPDGLRLDRMLLVLKRSPEQETALSELLVEQQVRSSPNYHRWLTPEEFGNQFGPADADVQTVSRWLRGQGFQIDRVSAGRSVIEFSGTAGLVREAFHTPIHQFVVNGAAYWSNSQDPQIPAALAPVVEGVASLNNFPLRRMSRTIPLAVRAARTKGPLPVYTYTGPDGKVYHPLTPADFETIYNIPASLNGSGNGLGQTIAIVAVSNVNLLDWDNFRGAFALAGPAPNVILNGPDPGIVPGPEAEADLDMEWAGAIAQFATVDLVVSEDTVATSGVDLSSLYIVDNNLAPVMSVSFGYCESALGIAGNAFFNSLWEQAAAQGISVVVGTGDNGSAACDAGDTATSVSKGLAVSGVASTSFNVAVGGTDFDDSSDPSLYWNSTNNVQNQSSALSYIPESTWNDSCAQVGVSAPCTPEEGTPFGLLGGGGGPSTCGVLTGADPNPTCVSGYPKPAWQTGPGVPADSVRDVPDVSLFSGLGRNGSFYLYCQSDLNQNGSTGCSLANGFQAIGGTSVSAQVFAAIMALVDQKTGERQGNPNYVLYKLAAQPGATCASNADAVHNSSCIFYDIVTGNNSVPCAAGSSDCEPGAPGGATVLVTPGSNPAVPAWTAVPGYDLATGLGSVNVANLVNKWSSVSFTPSATTLSISPTTLTHGEPASVTMHVTGQGGTPTGAVSLLAAANGSGQGIASFELADGIALGSTSALPGGTYNVTAHYGGDGNFGASDSSPVQVTVGKENSHTVLGIVTFDMNGNVTSNSASTLAYGSPYILHVGVENAAGNLCGASQAQAAGCPSGTVNLTDNGAPLDAAVHSLNSLGQMDDDPIQLVPGGHSIVASYLGDSSFNGSASNPDDITVTKAATTASLTSSSNTVSGPNSVTFTATVSTQSNGAAPSSAVEFLNGSSSLSGTVTYSPTAGGASGFAQLTATLLTTLSATATITAVFSGDGNYTGSSSAPQTVTVTPGFAVSVNPASLIISAPGESASAAVSVASAGGFSGAVSLTCELPATMAETTCSFSPATITNSGQSQLTVTTTAPQTAAGASGSRSEPDRTGRILGTAMLCLLVLWISIRRRVPFRAFALAVLLGAVMAGCGGGGGQSSAAGSSTLNSGTPGGTYAITVVASSGATAHQTTLTIVLQ